MCCSLYFLLDSTFFKGKVKSGIFGGFYCFFKRALKKIGGLFWFGPTASTLKKTMDVSLNF